MPQKVKSENFLSILDKIKDRFEKEDKDGREVWAESLNEMLNDLHGNDFFGTEGQLDPRGDHRNDENGS